MSDYIKKIKTASGDKQIDYTALANLPEILTALPSPNALTFTGAVTGTYDGSEAVTVEIPSGGAVSDEQVNSAVSAWLTEHPEATPTVQDGSVSEEKTTFFTKSFVELIGEM